MESSPNIESSQIITTIATIASLCENSNKTINDYLDIITPFIIQCLPMCSGTKVDLLNVKSKMQLEFGFIDMPLGVIKQILLRIADTPNSLLSKEGDTPDNQFTIKSTNHKNGFKDKCKKSKADLESVIKELIQFLNEEYGINCDTETAKKLLLESFSSFFATILDSEKGIISGSTLKKERRRVAKFILVEKNKASSTFDKIEELTRGYIVFQAIYFFEKQPSMVSTVDLENVTVYLDTPVLIDALEYRNAESTKTVNDMIKLVKNLGGTVKVFSHVVDELQGILEKYCEVFPNTNTFKLDGLIRKYKSKLGILAVSQSLQSLIGEQFVIEDAPPLGIIADWETLNIEEAIKRHYIQSLQKLPQSESAVGKNRIDNDTRSLMAIVKARNGNTPTTFDQCGAILLSDSRTARKTYASLRDGASSNEINFVYSVMDLSCLLWLSSTRCSSELKEDLLLYCVSAAIETSDRVIRKMLKYTHDLEAIGKIRPETALAMRSNPRAKEIIADFCDNDPQLVTEKTVIETANELMIEQKANERAIPKIRVWKKVTKITVTAIIGLILFCLIILPPILQITQIVSQISTLTIMIPMILGIIGAAYGFVGEKRVIQHIATISSNIVEDFILENEVKKARKHAEYFVK